MSVSGPELTSKDALEAVEALLEDLETDIFLAGARVVVALAADALPGAALRLRDDERLDYKYLSFASGIDFPDRMEAIYLLRSASHGIAAELRAGLDPGSPAVPTLSRIWSTAEWHERETFDLLGIVYEGHPDLRRILTRGEDGVFPLRKDARPHRVRREEWSFEGVGAAKRLPGEGKTSF